MMFWDNILTLRKETGELFQLVPYNLHVACERESATRIML